MLRGLLLIILLSHTFALYSQTINPATIPGLSLWLSADSVDTIGGKVKTWYDKSGNNYNSTQLDTLKSPQWTSSPTINDIPVIRFDGIDDVLNGVLIPNLNDSSISIFAVINGNEQTQTGSEAGIFTINNYTNGFWFNRRLYDQSLSLYNNFNGNGFINTLPGTLPNSGFTYKILEAHKTIFNKTELFINGILNNSSVDPILNGTFTNNIYVIGYSQSVSYLSGNIAEIILYNRVLNVAERLQVEQYLRFKYAPPVNLGSDINIDYGFCDTTIHAGSRFTKFVWDTGNPADTLEYLTVSHSGTYTVTVTDVFGFPSVDSINVSFPNTNLNINNATICAGDSILLKPQLSNFNNYTFTWSNGDTSPQIYAKTQGNYWVQIADISCDTKISNTVVITVDSFAYNVSLGNDITLCAGNTISIISPANYPAPLIFLWEGWATDSLFTVNSSDTIWVRVSNNLGCFAFDTIIVTIAGVAPQTNFIADTVCLGNITSFTNLTSGTDNLWLWDFGNGDTSILQNPTLTFNTADTFLVTLTATKGQCSKSIQKNVLMKTIPVANFRSSESCNPSPYQFIDNSIPNTPDSIISWNWNFGDNNFSNDANPINFYSNAGDYNVILTVTSSNGCADSIVVVANIIDNAPFPDMPQLSTPQNNSIIGGGNISFSWNNYSNAIKYKLIISDNQNFSGIVTDTVLLGYSIIITSSLLNSNSIFWKVLAYNICNDSIASDIHSFSLFNQTLIPGLSLWLSADSVDTIGGKVKTWYDKSGNNYNSTQLDTLKSPQWTSSPTINDIPVIRFDGIDDILNGVLIPNLNDSSISIFAVINGNEQTTGSEAGIFTINNYTNGFWFNRRLYDQSLSLYNNFNGNGFINTLPGTLPNSGFTYKILEAHKTIFNKTELFINGILNNSSVDPILNGTFTNNIYVIGHSQSVSYLSGNIAEIILYNRVLNVAERLQVEQYLRYKYAPPVNLGPDINIPYGFCPMTIHAGQRFTDFQWSRNGITLTTDSLESISITQNGNYKVIVTDIFGFTSSDSINVTFPPFVQLTDTTICFGDTLNWNLNLNGYYNYLWNDNDTSSIRNITLENTYQVTITDTTSQHCSIVTQPVFVNVDSFPNYVSLGPDANMCSGNTLYLQNGYNEAVTYLWNNGSTNNNYTVTDQDTINPIFVTITDSLGCIGKDTLTITGISGTAPIVGFSYDGSCFGNVMQFNDTSKSAIGDTIISWNWSFGNEGNATDINPTHSFSQPNIFSVKLLVTTSNGCINSKITDVNVHNLPTPAFNTTNNCSNNFTNFINQSSIPVDSITTYNWSFGDSTTSTNNNPTHIYSQEGNFNAILIATSNFGCIDTIEKTISIKTAPLTDFNYSPVCKGQPVFFADNTQNPDWYPIIFRKWDFGDAASTSTINPTHIYNTLGSYIVKYITKSINGCSDTSYKTLLVTMPPVAAFTGLDACVNSNHQLHDSSTSAIPLTQWKWKINTLGNFTEQNPVVVFTDTLHYNAELVVVSQAGCTDTISHIISVHSNPIAGFVIIPEVAAPLQTITFDNNSFGAISYFWNFDDGQTSFSVEPIHTFADSGLYNVSLISTNSYECKDSVFSSIRIVVPQYDIAVLEVSSKTTGSFLKVSTKIANFGSLPIDSVFLFLDMGNGVVIKEALNYYLQTGEVINYNFTSQLEITPQNSPSYICVDALPPSTITDFAPSNNHYCIALVDNFEVLPPYPSPVGNYIYIEFIIPAEGSVTIYLYNSLGQKMKTLFNQHANAGFNRYVYLAGEISNGAYYYQVEYNGKFKTQNFIKY